MLKEITELCQSLCEKDRKIAERLIKSRNFFDLKSLVDSSIIIYGKNLQRKNPNEELKSLNRENLIKLKAKVDEYVYLIEPEYDSYEEEEF